VHTRVYRTSTRLLRKLLHVPTQDAKSGLDTCPTGQVLHAVDADVLLYFPAVQLVQVAAAARLNVPGGHVTAVGLEDPAGQAYPAVQAPGSTTTTFQNEDREESEPAAFRISENMECMHDADAPTGTKIGDGSCVAIPTRVAESVAGGCVQVAKVAIHTSRAQRARPTTRDVIVLPRSTTAATL
jgi:hypothetical protein